ncbi:MAG: LamG domain-containing protein [Verrucomicrobiota bacterium]
MHVSIRLFILALFACSLSAQTPIADLMPSEEDHTSMWWRDGFPSVVKGADWRRVVKTGNYWFMLDTDTLRIPRLVSVNPSANELPDADLQLRVVVDGKVYHCNKGAEWTRFGGPRLIESGRFLQRADVTNLELVAGDGTKLNAEARFETAAWADQLNLIFAARPGQLPIVAGEESFGRVRGGFGLDGSNIFESPAEEADLGATFTLEFWVFVPKNFKAGKHSPWLVCKNHHEAADGNVGILVHPDAIPAVRFNIGGGQDNAISVRAERRDAFKLEQWNHVAVSYDGDVLQLYLNGHFVAEEQVGKARVPKPGALAFGKRQDRLAGFEFRGVIDEVRIYNRALRLEELRLHFHRPEIDRPASMEAREWTFREDIPMSPGRIRETWDSAKLELNVADHIAKNGAAKEDSWREVSLAIDPVTRLAVIPISEVNVEAGDRPVSFEPSVGWHRINLDGIESVGVGNDTIERIPLRLTNPTNREQIARLMFEKTARGIRQRIGTPITGVSAILRDADGNPTGIPVQLSKNWHDHAEGGVYNGQWFHGISQIRLPAAADVKLELVIVYGHWGGLPAASHSQLSLIGWGGNQRWDQSALGAWGESICYDPNQAQAQCTITDVRPLMVTSMSKTSPLFNWTNNVGGGDFFRFYDAAGERVPHRSMRTTYHRQGPCLTEVTYAGPQHTTTVSLARSDDVVRGIYKIRLDVKELAELSRFVIFQIGADTYSSTGERKMAVGDESGLIREWETQWGGNVYRTEPFECKGRILWASLHEAERRENHPDGAWANRGVVIREWKAQFGGEDAKPWIAERGLDLPGGKKSSTLDILLPPTITKLEPGDFIEATIEHIIVPQFAKDYHGPNEALRAALREHENTWRMIEREAVNGDREVEVTTGDLERLHPDIRIKTVENAAELQLSGGVGFVPITFTGLTSHACLQLLMNGEVFDQSVHGSDFWQTDFDSRTGTWSRTYNVPAPAPGESHKLQLK